jgi:CheY-like chemotaxis protein
MPEMSGRALTERITAQRPDVRVLFMSGYTDDEIVRRGLGVAGTALLDKPFTAEALLGAVRGSSTAHGTEVARAPIVGTRAGPWVTDGPTAR